MSEIIINASLLKPDTLTYLEAHTGDAEKALDIGVMVLSTVQASKDMDFVKSAVEGLLHNTETTLSVMTSNVQKSLDDIVSKHVTQNFSPDNPGSYPDKFGRFLNEKASLLIENVKNSTQSINDILNKVEENTSEKESSAIGRMKKIISDSQAFIQSEFDENNTKSYAYQAKAKIADMVGEMDKKTAETIRKEMGEVIKPIMDEFIQVRELLAKEEGKAEMKEYSTGKGTEFEDVLMQSLEAIAAPHGDSVEQTGSKKEATGSKKGDFIYIVNGTGAKIVIEAKDKFNVGQKESIDYLKEAIIQRVADFGILVSADSEQHAKQIGKWNIYDNKMIICSAEDIQTSLRIARTILQLITVKKEGSVNVGVIETSVKKLISEMKRCAGIKTYLTNLKNSTTDTVEKCRVELEGMQEQVLIAVKEIESEL